MIVKHTAYERGAQAAGLYKKLTKTMRLSNDACISWAQKNVATKHFGTITRSDSNFLFADLQLCFVG